MVDAVLTENTSVSKNERFMWKGIDLRYVLIAFYKMQFKDKEINWF